MDIYSIGEMVIDFIPGEEKGSYIRNAGGAPANVAIAAARNGLETGMCCKVGEDDFGKFLMETLKKEGAQVFFGNSIFTVGGRTVKAVDATEAGDAFWGGFLSSLLLQGVTRPEETQNRSSGNNGISEIFPEHCVYRKKERSHPFLQEKRSKKS